MNLVDAIRMTSAAHSHEPEAPLSCASTSAEVLACDAPISPSLTAQNFVRLEIFLSPDQVQRLLKDSIGANRTVMTAHEVAHLLRTTKKKVEELAGVGELPGFTIEGSWRFLRTTIEERLISEST